MISTLFDVRQLSSENYIFLCSHISDFDASVSLKASFVKSDSSTACCDVQRLYVSVVSFAILGS